MRAQEQLGESNDYLYEFQMDQGREIPQKSVSIFQLEGRRIDLHPIVAQPSGSPRPPSKSRLLKILNSLRIMEALRTTKPSF